MFPQFVSPEQGTVLLQSIALGCTRMLVNFSVSLLIALSPASTAFWFARNPFWLAVQRYLIGFVLGAFAMRLALEQRRNA